MICHAINDVTAIKMVPSVHASLLARWNLSPQEMNAQNRCNGKECNMNEVRLDSALFLHFWTCTPQIKKCNQSQMLLLVGCKLKCFCFGCNFAPLVGCKIKLLLFLGCLLLLLVENCSSHRQDACCSDTTVMILSNYILIT
ncbi:hypothetical protein O6H91_14G024000 [Diphasiastrum complanatum]|uniref:Uncharacterized protein n=1 Tax=Diphasiastrum complanatum TaxID=34168 RepID=A0ACC2BMG9_DIPCM|nr:hypothetical protein O6H91_14G024000 [Diphasiastrum complanatum]